ncbi:MAG: hypothetical protein Q7U16_12015 [Agitococcus sp.]|nr:hypothetical protein [Agitococcus sp.]
MDLMFKIILILVIATLIIALPWVLTFWNGHISNLPSDWGVFGDYVGGTLATFTSILALVALLYTLNSQQKQINLIIKQANKSDILAAIDRLEKDFQICLNRYPIKLERPNGVREDVTGFDVLFNITIEYKYIITPKEKIKETEEYHTNNPNIRMFEMFGIAAGELNQIRLYCELLEKITESNLLSRYYHRKYRLPYERLRETGYITVEWHQT